MPMCIITGCKNRSDPQKKHNEQIEKERIRRVSFHRFPLNQDRRQRWLEAIKLSNWVPPKTGTICSDHFLNDDFQNWSTSRRTLKETAIPSTNVVYRTSPINLVEQKNKTTNEICKGEQNDKATVNVPMTDIVHMVEKHDEVAELSNCSLHSQKVEFSTSISPRRIFNTARKQQLRFLHRQEVKSLRIQLYRSKQQQTRQKKRIQALEKILLSLKRKNLLPLETWRLLKISVRHKTMLLYE